MPDDKKIIETLNYSGVYLQEWCHDAFKKVGGWKVREEIPFFFPTYNPTISPSLWDKEGSIDLLAIKNIPDSEMYVCLVVECKRADPNLKNWILRPAKYHSPAFYSFSANNERTGSFLALNSWQIPKLDINSGGTKIDIYNQIFEVNEKLNSINRNKVDNSYSAMSQVNRELCAVVNDNKLIQKIFIKDYLHILLLPIVVTTANLVELKFKGEDVDFKNGTLPDYKKADIKSLPWAIYDFAFPEYLLRNGAEDLFEQQKGGSMSVKLEKNPIIIVNSEHFTDFLDKVVSNTCPFNLPNRQWLYY